MKKLIIQNRKMIWDLACNDFSTKYAGSAFGIFWAFIQPVITMVVYWVVFEFGLKATPPVENVPYVLWFSAGMVPWFFFSDGINAVANCLLEYSYLVKKVVFDIELLPVIKMISTLFVHAAFIVLLFVICFCTGKPVTVYMLQLFYYLICLVVLIYALGKMTAALLLFLRDLGQLVNIALQIGVWATPIIWSYVIVPEKFQWIVKLNPVFYIVEGYRDCFFQKQWFYDSPVLTGYFWIVTVMLLLAANMIFKKMRPHFADVL